MALLLLPPSSDPLLVGGEGGVALQRWLAVLLLEPPSSGPLLVGGGGGCSAAKLADRTAEGAAVAASCCRSTCLLPPLDTCAQEGLVGQG